MKIVIYFIRLTWDQTPHVITTIPITISIINIPKTLNDSDGMIFIIRVCSKRGIMK